MEAVLDVEITGGNRRKITKLMIKVKQRMNRKRSSFVEHPRKELTLTNGLSASVISSLSISTELSAHTAVSMDTLQRYAST